ncbi:MAG TPA: IS110 family transposase [Acidimicrobiales bacterium]|nr:IS110 family transposase [Acidimicrobiales bacterium]
MTTVEAVRGVTGGVDTHLDVHVAAALDPLGTLLGSRAFETTPAGYQSLLDWLEGFGAVAKVGVEGTGSYGTGLARFLRKSHVEMIEVDRPNRAARRRSGKSDPLDAVEAARAALGGRASSISKSKDGAVEAIRVLVVAKRSARQARVKALTQMRHLIITAPDQLRSRLKGLTVIALVNEAARLRPSKAGDAVTAAHKASLCSLAKRIQGLEEEIAELDQRIEALLVVTAPELLSRFGVGPDTAAALLVSAGDNPERLHSEAAWAHLCGVAPIPASSGKTTRHRLDRGGDRNANSALWRIVMVRIAHDPNTTAYFERKVKEGRSKRDVIRLLKRYVAREMYHYLPRV